MLVAYIQYVVVVNETKENVYDVRIKFDNDIIGDVTVTHTH